MTTDYLLATDYLSKAYKLPTGIMMAIDCYYVVRVQKK